MRRIYWYMAGRLYEARAIRALRLHHKFLVAKEVFFRRAGIDRNEAE